MMSWEQVAGLADAGIECGGHSHTHRELDTLRQSSVAREVQASRDALRDAIGEVRTFAYPHGHHSQRVVRAVRDAGYESACAVGDQLLRPPGDRWALSRLVVRGGMTAVDLERALSPPRLRGTSGRARRAGWRIVRRARAVRAR
jgi:peptidoglycan/xylan/chitin deacetylase (PgdA/CDA1 family)